jgi:hypothetical protein
MPTILRFRGFNVMIFVNDHGPAHVHAVGKDAFAIFNLNCPLGPVSLREDTTMKANDRRAVERFLNDNLVILCERWREVDDQRNRVARG